MSMVNEIDESKEIKKNYKEEPNSGKNSRCLSAIK